MINLKKLTFNCVLSSISKKFYKKTAIIFNNKKITYKELYDNSINYTNNLLNLGIKKGDKVAILLSNRLEYIYFYFALFIIGAWVVPITIKCEPFQLKNILKNADVNAIIYEVLFGNINYHKILPAFKTELPLLKKYILVSEEKSENSIAYKELLQSKIYNKKLTNEEPEPDDVALIAFSSGTTGTPKCVLITHRSLILSSYYAGEKLNLHDDICFTVAPFFSAHEFIVSLIYIFSGSTMKWISTLNPNDIIVELLNKDITMFHSQTPLWKLLLSLPYINNLKFDHLKKVIVFGSLCTYNLANTIEDLFGCPLLNVYSSIESAGAILNTSLNDSKEIRWNTVGQPIKGVEIKIVDKNRNSLKKGEVGELVIKGYLLKEYYKNDEKTKKTIESDVWFYTGDMAYYFDDQNIKIVGFTTDVVIKNNLKIYPIDIEESLLKFNKVQDVCVIGNFDESSKEKLAAFIIPNPSTNITYDEVKKFCKNNIQDFKIPDKIFFVSQFPILPSGKIQKNILRQWSINGVPEENLMLFDGKSLLSKKNTL